jgi:hypothetical protein
LSQPSKVAHTFITVFAATPTTVATRASRTACQSRKSRANHTISPQAQNRRYKTARGSAKRSMLSVRNVIGSQSVLVSLSSAAQPRQGFLFRLFQSPPRKLYACSAEPRRLWSLWRPLICFSWRANTSTPSKRSADPSFTSPGTRRPHSFQRWSPPAAAARRPVRNFAKFLRGPSAPRRPSDFCPSLPASRAPNKQTTNEQRADLT